MNDGKEAVAETYIANTMEGSPFKPSKAYMDLIIHGAQENGLSVNYVEKLKEVECEEEEMREIDIENGKVLLLQRKAKETSGSINPENNRIGGKKLSASSRFVAGKKLRNRDTLVNQ